MFIKQCIGFLFFSSIFLTPTVSSVLGSYPTNLTNPPLGFSPQPIQPDLAQEMTAQPDFQVIKGIIQTGDTIFSLLNRYLPMQTIYRLNRQNAQALSLRQVKKGHIYRFFLQEDNLTGFEYEINKKEKFILQKGKTDFAIKQIPIAYDLTLKVVSTTITSSMLKAVRKSGNQKKLSEKLSDLFVWDIDFTRDIQPGDRFQVLIEKHYQDGKFMGYGKIQATISNNNGMQFKTFLDKDSNGVYGYYD